MDVRKTGEDKGENRQNRWRDMKQGTRKGDGGKGMRIGSRPGA